MSAGKKSLSTKEVYVFFHPKKECSFVLEDGASRISLIFKDIRVAHRLVDLHSNLLPSPGYFLIGIKPDQYPDWLHDCVIADNATHFRIVEGVSKVDGDIRIDGSQYPLPTRAELERDSKPATDGQHRHRGWSFGRQ